jgi:hypothetical protein
MLNLVMTTILTQGESKLMEVTKKDKLKGVGDLSILSFCDLGSQFFHKSKFTAIGVTFDARLRDTLINHSQISAMSQQFVMGRDTEKTNRAKLDEFFNKTAEVSAVKELCHRWVNDFLDKLHQLEWVAAALTVSNELKAKTESVN